MARLDGRRPYSRGRKKKGERHTHETETYTGEVKTGNYVVARNKNMPDQNIIFTDKKELKDFINMLTELKNKL